MSFLCIYQVEKHQEFLIKQNIHTGHKAIEQKFIYRIHIFYVSTLENQYDGG